MENNPEELPLSFEGRGEVKGFSFRQIKRSNTAYIFEVSVTFGKKWYEVFKRREDLRFGKIAYPKSKSFGINAWCCISLRKAVERLEKSDTSCLNLDAFTVI